MYIPCAFRACLEANFARNFGLARYTSADSMSPRSLGIRPLPAEPKPLKPQSSSRRIAGSTVSRAAEPILGHRPGAPRRHLGVVHSVALGLVVTQISLTQLPYILIVLNDPDTIAS